MFAAALREQSQKQFEALFLAVFAIAVQGELSWRSDDFRDRSSVWLPHSSSAR
jgi:hypothetical protein